ncbi:hypothetical protein ACJIZ3_004133 [Penstemon smallii]|uniref:Protein transport protein sec16 n=1 Tax=Penstemon smallii TaxID=265156 RepID=A0ABD3S160_9LAMI
MASNPPPFQVEDNTDDDFFDKLVNVDDDVDFNVETTSSASVGTDENESNEVKAFANLTINNYDDASMSNHNNADVILRTEIKHINNIGTLEETANSLVEFGNSVHMQEIENGGAEGLSDTTVVSKSSGESFSDATVVSKSSVESGASGVKEVGWNAFHADLDQNSGNGFGSYSDFFDEFGGNNAGDEFENLVGVSSDNGPQVASEKDVHVESSNSNGQCNEGNNYGIAADQSADVQDLNNSQYWENQYPGWKYDPSTGQWYQIDGYDAGASVLANVNSSVTSEVSYLQQSAQYIAGSVSETGTMESVTNWKQASHVSNATENTTNWNQVSQVSVDTAGVQSDWNKASQETNGYPPHMVFDPQYPGWYYDTVTQQWRTLESYYASAQSSAQIQEEINQNGYAPTDTFSQNSDQMTHSTRGQGNGYISQDFGSQGQDQSWAGPVINYNKQGSTMWQPDTGANEPTSQYSGSQLMGSHYRQNFSVRAHGSQPNSVHYGATGSYYENASQVHNFPMPSRSQGFVGANFSQQLNDSRTNQNDQKHASNDYYNNQNSVNFSQQQIQHAQISYASAPGRSSAGRPAHALVAFGFGGKLVVMKDTSCSDLSFGSQTPVGGTVSVLNLAEVVNANVDASNYGMGVCNYFQVLCQQSVPGPLAGGSVGTKELNKWIDERIANPASADIDYRKAEVLRLLLSLLRIACQYYGKLRSPYGTDSVLKESDTPESAIARLFASAKRNGSQFSQYGAVAQCLQQMPSEEQMLVTAAEVQNLLVSGRKKEALQCAQEGQLWGPALVLAAELGDQFYAETVKQMALRQLVAGSPLRTLCLLIAGQPADVFLADNTAISSMAGALNMPQQPAQFGANCMLDEWEENLAVITANRTKDDELVLMHLGDCLWKEKSDIIAAHMCYLVAEASFEPYSDSARLCLVGADHWKFPRTYASPEAIQRTEIYEYSKTLGNSQFVLLPFQPYKLVYSYMLAEVGRIADALKYSQAVLKSLKNGRTPEVESLRHLASSLEERIKAHQQGGFSTNLAPKKLVGKLLNLFDSTAHRVVGGLPPPVPAAGGTVQGNENHHHSNGLRVSNSQSTMAMSSLMPSQSMEPINVWAADSNRVARHTRSVSEPDFGRSPRQGQTDSMKEASSSGKASAVGFTSRFGRFGFGSQLLQKTVGLVLKPRQDHQAKLGETNKFYYDEKLKRWVEEGANPPAEEAALPPPPTTAVFQNGTSSSDYNLKNALQSEATSHSNSGSPAESQRPSALDQNSGIPPLPPTSNQYSARGRMGVRSRYVDTFNQGGGNATNHLFQSPSVPSMKSAISTANRKFFVPAPVVESNIEQPVDAPVNSTMQDTTSTYENSFLPPQNDSYQTPPSSMNMQRFASINNISKNGSFSLHSRRTASWSGSFNNDSSSFKQPTQMLKPLGEVLGMNDDDLLEVEL